MLTYEVLKERYSNLKKSHNEIFDELFRTDKENKHLNKQLDQALKELDELQQRIDKAIAYIKQRTEFGEYDYAFPSVLNQDEVRKIRNILNGSDKNE